jgi:hypothetical protein
LGSTGAVKRHSKNDLTHYPTLHTMRPSWDMATTSEMGPTIVVRFAKAQGSKENPPSRVRVAQSNQSERRRDTKGGQQLAHLVPH